MMMLATAAGEKDPAALSQRIDRFFAADSVRGKEKEAKKIVALAPGFDDVYRRLGAGRGYSADVKRGMVERSRRNHDGQRHRYFLVVPKGYDPARSYPVCVYLHGAVDRPEPEGPPEYWWRDPDRLQREDRIAVVPAAWNQSKWWQASQVENVEAILREVKRTYNVDENQVSLIGISDGGTGTWFFAFRAPTPFASFLPFIGSPYVMANPEVGAEGPLPFPNLNGRSLLVINGTDDPLYPAEKQRRLLDFAKQVGALVTFDVVEGGAHNVRWWPEKADEIQAFIRSHRRDPLPDYVFWATDRTCCFNRAFWVVVDELAPAGSSDKLELALLGDQPERLGGLEVRRQGNRIDVASHGVRRYRLLLSPEEVDLDAEVVVTTNGAESFRGLVPRSLTTLLDWASRDMDRTMLFAAELAIEVPN
jgi:predicted esterase